VNFDTTCIRVMLVDDHRIVREGVRALLASQKDMLVVGEASDTESLLAQCRTAQPDVVLLDLRLGATSGVAAIHALKRDHKRIRIVVLTAYNSESHVCSAVAAGAHGYILKDGDPSNIIDGIRAVHAGRRYIAADAAVRLAEHVNESGPTARELEVLALVARGGKNKDIARTLHISVETVKEHLGNVFGKLGAADRTDAALKAIRRGLLDLD
jgi:DNA-binding NarL/FixJ family response regulator